MKKISIDKEILKAVKEEAKRLGKDVGWFKFARIKKGDVWVFLPDKDFQLRKLEQLVKKVGKKFPQFTTGQITEKISRMVNN